MLPLIIFFAIVAATLFIGGLYVFGGWLVRKRPNSPWGSALAKLPLFASFLKKGVQETEATARGTRKHVGIAASVTSFEKRWSFKNLGEGDSLVVTQPDTGEELTMRTEGTAIMRTLVQENDQIKTSPWVADGNELTFQVLAGRRPEWLIELPNGWLALLTAIERVGDAEMADFIAQAKTFGASGQSATNCPIIWDGSTLFLWDIARIGVHSSQGKRAPWSAAPSDPGQEGWEKRYMQKVMTAGPMGGKRARHKEGEPLMMVMAQSGGTGGFVLKGFLIKEESLQDVRTEGE